MSFGSLSCLSSATVLSSFFHSLVPAGRRFPLCRNRNGAASPEARCADVCTMRRFPEKGKHEKEQRVIHRGDAEAQRKKIVSREYTRKMRIEPYNNRALQQRHLGF